MFADADPLVPPLQETEVALVAVVNADGSVITTLEVAVQPFASVVTTEYAPADKFVAVAVLCVGFEFQL